MRKYTPNWFQAMQKYEWTLRRIRFTFGVPSAIAEHIQSSFPSYDECKAIAAAHRELTSQVGH